MLRSWISAGMLLVGLGGAALAGCDDGATSDDVGGSEDNLKGKHQDKDQAKPSADGEEGKQPERPAGDQPKEDDIAAACAAVTCPVNHRCEVQEVQCVRAPCPPIASCVPVDVKEDPAPRITCATTLCAPDTICVDRDDGPQCVKREPTGGCAVTLCRAGTTCVETDEGAKCVEPCTAKCSAGQHCEFVEVQCIRAPCPPQPTCVDDVDACATVRCKAGTHCELKEVQCIRAPCDPIAECVAD